MGYSIKLKTQKESGIHEEPTVFCEETGFPWADEMLDSKSSYDGISGFGLTPVYRTYEKYFYESAASQT